ncbi:hypothetical protein ACTI_83290 [Actinoplanes sp. OR16]|nr:hypothetical protein ACTI_83290 [Actinoplanes sp. OR16]
MIVLLERTRSMPLQEMVPETRMFAAAVEARAVVSADALVTVVVAADPPPVVPPFCVAHPTRSVMAYVCTGAADAPPAAAAVRTIGNAATMASRGIRPGMEDSNAKKRDPYRGIRILGDIGSAPEA